ILDLRFGRATGICERRDLSTKRRSALCDGDRIARRHLGGHDEHTNYAIRIPARSNRWASARDPYHFFVEEFFQDRVLAAGGQGSEEIQTLRRNRNRRRHRTSSGAGTRAN